MVIGVAAVTAVVGPSRVFSEPDTSAPSAKATEAIQLLASDDPYNRQLGFLRLEALREPATLPTIQGYVTHKDPELRAYSLRAVGAIQGRAGVAFLLEHLKTERHPRVRRAILLALEPHESSAPEILSVFLRALRDRHTEVRMAAVDIVSRIDDPRAREAIVERHRREQRRDVRRVLDLAMQRLRSSN
jgi:HEAT repeat protein